MATGIPHDLSEPWVEIEKQVMDSEREAESMESSSSVIILQN
jgi:hypothetical protein